MTIFDLMLFGESAMSASQVVLSNNGIASVPVQRAGNNLTTPRVELQIIMGAQEGHVHNIPGSGSVYDAYNATLHGTVVTDRSQNPTDHPQYVARVMSYLADPSQLNANMPYHYIPRIQSTGHAVQLVENLNFDVTNISLSFPIFIRNDAWSSLT